MARIRMAQGSGALESSLDVRPWAQQSDPWGDSCTPVDTLEKMKSCSVVTYSVSPLLQMPWSGIHRKGEGPLESISLRAPQKGSSLFSSCRWNVSGQGAGLVGNFERSVFRALEWIANESSIGRGVAFQNPLVVHPRDICERLCWRATQHKFDAIGAAMESLSRIQIDGIPNRSFPTQSRPIRVLRSVVRGVPITTNGIRTSPSYLVSFDRFFVDAVNSGHVHPINWALWISLRNPVARRLLEILDPEFSAPRGILGAVFDKETIGRLLPLDGAIPEGRQRVILEQAHEALLESGYLQWVQRLPSGGGEIYFYHPGPTYHALRRRLVKTPDPDASYRRLSEAILSGRPTPSPGRVAMRLDERWAARG